MECKKRNSDDEIRIIILPLQHDEHEDDIYNILPTMIHECDNIAIYLEAINRSKNNEYTDIKQLGLEDPKLLALFEICLFQIVYNDFRLYDVIYKGIGVQIPPDDKLSRVTISRDASSAAKGSQAILNLRDSGTTLDQRLDELLKEYDIDKLVERHNDHEYILNYNKRLTYLYYTLIEVLSLNKKYSEYIDFNFISHTINNISDDIDLFDSLSYGVNIKEYLKSIRDQSNCRYIIEHLKSIEVQNAIVEIGGAHAENLRFYLSQMGIKVIIVDLLNGTSNDNLEDEIYDEIFKYLV